MVVFWIALAVVVVVACVVFGRMTNSAGFDRLRKVDPDAAARIEQQRAEQALRGQAGGQNNTFGIGGM